MRKILIVAAVLFVVALVASVTAPTASASGPPWCISERCKPPPCKWGGKWPHCNQPPSPSPPGETFFKNCAGQYVIHNRSSYIVQAVALNNPNEHLDVQPWVEETKGHVAFNQPVVFYQYRAGYQEKYLGSVQVAGGCNFDGEMQIFVYDSIPPALWFPGGFSPYFPPPWSASW